MAKKFLALTLALAMLFALVACSATQEKPAAQPETAQTEPEQKQETDASSEQTEEPAAQPQPEQSESDDGLYLIDAGDISALDGKEFTIGFAAPTLNNAFFGAVEDGIRQSLAAHPEVKVNIVEVDQNQDAVTMNDKIADLVSTGIDLLLLDPCDSVACESALLLCQQAGIPVVNYDAPVDDTLLDYVESTVASDNTYAGYVCGVDMASKMEDGAKILALDSPRASACIERYEGFLKGLDESGKSYQLVNTLDCVGDQQTALQLTTDALVADPDLFGIFAINDPSAMGAVLAIEQSTTGLSQKILVYGVDGSPEAKTMINEGRLEGTGSQSPLTIGYNAMETAFAVLAGNPVEKTLSIATFLVTKDNVSKYGIDGWQ